MLKHKKIIILFISIMLFIVAGVATGIVLHFNSIESNKTLSLDNNYIVSYNKSTKTVEIVGLNNDLKGFESPSGWIPAKDPVFSWSPDSRFLAITYSDVRGYKWTQLTDFLYNRGLSIPMKSEIQDACEETQTEDKYSNLNTDIYIRVVRQQPCACKIFMAI